MRELRCPCFQVAARPFSLFCNSRSLARSLALPRSPSLSLSFSPSPLSLPFPFTHFPLLSSRFSLARVQQHTGGALPGGPRPHRHAPSHLALHDEAPRLRGPQGRGLAARGAAGKRAVTTLPGSRAGGDVSVSQLLCWQSSHCKLRNRYSTYIM